jgi:hypothetical protein
MERPRVRGRRIGILLVAAVVSFCVVSWFATQVLSAILFPEKLADTVSEP